MAHHASVSGCVTSIVASFSNGIEVLKKLRKEQRRKRTDRSNVDEAKLTKSLYNGRDDISREYRKSVQTVGDKFATGDAIAQTSLAEILLKLNAGLVSIISSFLGRERKDQPLDYHSLTDLSERSRIDVCKVLRQLLRRSIRFLGSPLTTVAEKHERGRQESQRPAVDGKPRKDRVHSKAKKHHGPVLARVTIANSSQPSLIAQVRPSERRKKSRSSSSTNLSSAKKASVGAQSPSPPPYTSRENLPRPTAVPQAQKSRTLTTAKLQAVTDKTQPSPDAKNASQMQSISLTEPRRRNQQTPTFYSMASDNTKLGEIPVHLWAVQPDLEAMAAANREAQRKGWPQVPGGNNEKKRAGFFGLFKRR